MQILPKMTFAVTILAAFMCFDVSASRASQYGNSPWCAVENDGDRFVWDCEYDSIADCRPAVLSGNRGFCARNPYGGQTDQPR
jgi:Protein of unknown function (DUF3551)